MQTYATFADYNADVIAAREAYNADMAVENGMCAACKTRKKDGRNRRCWTCRHGAATS